MPAITLVVALAPCFLTGRLWLADILTAFPSQTLLGLLPASQRLQFLELLSSNESIIHHTLAFHSDVILRDLGIASKYNLSTILIPRTLLSSTKLAFQMSTSRSPPGHTFHWSYSFFPVSHCLHGFLSLCRLGHLVCYYTHFCIPSVPLLLTWFVVLAWKKHHLLNSSSWSYPHMYLHQYKRAGEQPWWLISH